MKNYSSVIVTIISLVFSINFAGLQSSHAAPKASATPVTDVDNPARQPFSESANAFFQNGSRDVILNLPLPPAGKELVIEFVTINALIPTGENLWSASINRNPLVIVPQGDVGSGNDAFTASQQVRLYVSSQESILFIVSRNTTAGGGVVGVTISGYLVDVP